MSTISKQKWINPEYQIEYFSKWIYKNYNIKFKLIKYKSSLSRHHTCYTMNGQSNTNWIQ